MKMIKLGTPVKDSASQLDGMVVHMQIQAGGNSFYNFQPKGLSPETGQPLKRFWCAAARIVGGVEVPEPKALTAARAVLNTEVEDISSGFKGIAIAITLHISGCVHVSVKPPGLQAKSGESIAEDDFDIRLLRGPAIKPLSDEELTESTAKHPSPSAMESCLPKAI